MAFVCSRNKHIQRRITTARWPVFDVDHGVFQLIQRTLKISGFDFCCEDALIGGHSCVMFKVHLHCLVAERFDAAREEVGRSTSVRR